MVPGKPSDERLAAGACYAARKLLEGLAAFAESDPEFAADVRKQLPNIEITLEQQLRYFQSLKPSAARDLEVNTLTQLLHDIRAAALANILATCI